MTLNEIRIPVGCDLHDEDQNNYRWSDDELDRHILHAVKATFQKPVPSQQTVILPTSRLKGCGYLEYCRQDFDMRSGIR